jgi:hypothetical protein
MACLLQAFILPYIASWYRLILPRKQFSRKDLENQARLNQYGPETDSYREWYDRLD